MPRTGDFDGDWHKAVPENWTWIIVGGILTIVWVGGIFLLLFPQFEKPDRPIPLGPALVLTGILAAVLSVALYREELTEVRFGADGLAVRFGLGRVLFAPWDQVERLSVNERYGTVFIGFQGRAFGWRARFPADTAAKLLKAANARPLP